MHPLFSNTWGRGGAGLQRFLLLFSLRSLSGRKTGVRQSARVSRVVAMASPSQKGRWKGMDADQDMSDDQQDITRGRMMVE